MNSVLLLGGTGYVGSYFQQLFSRRSVQFQVVSRSQCDYTQRGLLAELIRSQRPRFLINAAGCTGRPNVNACEQNKTQCLSSNTVLPGLIREVCESYKVAWGHVSSGCIYTGEGPRPEGFRESDPPNFCFRQNNCSFYSGCKALAEEILEGAECCYIWRLRIPFNGLDHPRNYLTKLMRYERLLNVRNSLSHIDDCVSSCWSCYEREAEYGVYNMTNPGSVTTSEVVDLLQRKGLCGPEVQYFDSEQQFLQAVDAVPRSNCVLDTAKAVAAGVAPRPVWDALQEAIDRWQGAPLAAEAQSKIASRL